MKRRLFIAKNTGRLDLRLFYLARTLYMATEQVIGISIPIIVYRDTRDPTLAALSFFAIWAPRCLFPFVAVRLIDATAPRLQMKVVDALRITTLLGIAVLPVGAWLLIGAGLLSLLNLWAIALFEKGLSVAAPSNGGGSDRNAVEAFSAALRADRVALTVSTIIGGTLLASGTETLLIMGSVVVLCAAHVLQARSNLLHGLVTHRANPIGIWPIVRGVFANKTLRRLIYLLWGLNLQQGMVFGALPVMMEAVFHQDPATAAAVFAGIHIGSWVVLRAYPAIASHWAQPVRATWAIVLYTLGLIAAFLTGNVVFFAVAICLPMSIRNSLDVETIILRNRQIPDASFGQIMTVFLPLIYAPFAVAGLIVTWVFQLGGPPLLAPVMVVGALLFVVVWWVIIRQAFNAED